MREDSASPLGSSSSSPNDKRNHVPRQAEDGVVKAEGLPEHGKSDHSESRWTLTPMRDHAALNSGTKSLAEQTKVTLIAWPVELHDAEGNKVGAGTLTSKERLELEDGFKNLVDPNGKAGMSCVPVWMSDEVSLRLRWKYGKY